MKDFAMFKLVLQWRMLFVIFASFLLTCIHKCWSYEILQSIPGTIGAENYTYYRLTHPGRLLIELKSFIGDADLFVSDETLAPKFEGFQYELQSTSCGDDFVEIPESLNRPVGIGVYGYSSQDVTKYLLSVILLPAVNEMEYEQFTHYFHDYEAADELFRNYDASDYMYRDVKPGTKINPSSNSESDNSVTSDDNESIGSVLYQVLITVLKVVFEVIL